MRYHSFKPGPPLGDFIHNFWLYEDYVVPQLKDHILPSGTIELVINLRDDELRIYDATLSGQYRRFSGAIVSGAYGGFFAIDTLQETLIMGVHFKPGGAFPFLGVSANELTDTHVDLETLWGRAAINLRERLCAAATPMQRFALMEEAMLSHQRRPLEHHYAVPIALAALGQTDDDVSVRDVARHVGLSQRRFIQVFKGEVGLTPKLFSRVQRFQRVLTLVQQTPPDWARLAVECGYFDQSHLIRDFVSFSGFNPTEYFDHQKLLSRQKAHIKFNHFPLPENR
ncbi:MAG: helix-turn-helix transcriptional regulator [Leptolyngbyaceae cyanobacterium CSU_1_3]|nr:helix-turn-helix transcriptional regulator [Leptolyngbyaceae cyanobacterium CSU_1_3]